MSTPAISTYSEAEYLQFERASVHKHEYYAGEVIVLAGSSEQHNTISINIIAHLYGQLQGQSRGCRVYSSDMRIYSPASRSYMYPDVSILCQPADFVDEERDTSRNPIVVIEILSPSTERYDRGQKFTNYRIIPSLQDYVLVSQDRMLVEHYSRQENERWLFIAYMHPDNILTLGSVDCQLSLGQVYNGVMV